MLLVLFFFQAEDGIRDLVRSRGLGDVYKRQILNRRPILIKVENLPRKDRPQYGLSLADIVYEYSVSYTHLTLPTNYSV